MSDTDAAVRARSSPELRDVRAQRDGDAVTFLFPGGFLSRRKSLEDVIPAFSAVTDPSLWLLVKTQDVGDRLPPERERASWDPRITLLDEDLATADYLRLLASADACLAPARWEGLGLHLFEAAGLGVPVITNDRPPMSEVVQHDANGLLVDSLLDGAAPSGIPAYRPDPATLEAAIRRMADPDLRRRLAKGARRASRDRLSWARTIEGIRGLIA